VDTALKRLGGDRKLYLNRLIQFMDRHDLSREEFTEALTRKDLDTARRAALLLRGQAAALGAAELAAAAAELESVLDRGPESQAVEMAGAACFEALDELRAMLRNALPQSAPPTRSSLDPTPEALEALEQLRCYLEDDDAAAREYFEQHADSLATAFSRENFNALRHAIDSFDFERALAAMRGPADSG
jgi:HPt (histidine-containing phosphotransfer) domain-containing protein